jgi:ankyrin repeat protein
MADSALTPPDLLDDYYASLPRDALQAAEFYDSLEVGDLQKEFCAAVWRGDLEDVEHILSRPGRININSPEEGRGPPLHVAVDRGSLPLVQLLLSKGARVDATDAQGQTALQRACAEATADIASALLDAGADANFRGHGSLTTPLHITLAPLLHRGYNKPPPDETRIHLCRLLLAQGANIDGKEFGGDTPVFYLSTITPPFVR